MFLPERSWRILVRVVVDSDIPRMLRGADNLAGVWRDFPDMGTHRDPGSAGWLNTLITPLNSRPKVILCGS